MTRRTWVVLALLLASAVDVRAQKVERISFDADGARRTYHLFIPDAARDAAAPLLVLLHGSGRDGRSLLDPWQGLAKQEGIAGEINKDVWEFLKQHRLEGEPKYQQYAILRPQP